MRGVVGGTICIASVVGEKRVVARLGFEPRQTDSKSVVLPLHNLATQKHYSTNHLPDAKKCGDEFWWESFHYLAQRTQRAWRQSSLPTLLHASYFTLPTSSCVTYLAQSTQRARRQSSLPTSDFMLPTSYSVIPCRVLAPGAWNLRGVPINECLSMQDAVYLTRRRGGRGGNRHNRRAATGCGSTTNFILVHAEAQRTCRQRPMQLTYLWDIARRTGGDGAVGAGGVCPYYVGEICAGEICAGEICASEICAGEVGVGEVGVSEICTG